MLDKTRRSPRWSSIAITFKARCGSAPKPRWPASLNRTTTAQRLPEQAEEEQWRQGMETGKLAHAAAPLEERPVCTLRMCLPSEGVLVA